MDIAQHTQECKCERGMNLALAQVRQFHQTFGHPVGEVPQMMDPDLTEKRANYSAEELLELRE